MISNHKSILRENYADFSYALKLSLLVLICIYIYIYIYIYMNSRGERVLQCIGIQYSRINI